MKLAFYYHITLTKRDNNFFCPGYLGVFIDSLAQNVEQLFLVMHQSNQIEVQNADYKIQSQNIIWINLGHKTPVWHRGLFYRKILKKQLKAVQNCEAMIVRSPSPLAPYFPKYLSNTKVFYMVVGDYLESVKQTKIKRIRDFFELSYLRWNDSQFRAAMRGKDILVNSPALLEKYKHLVNSVELIKTTTLSNSDFNLREDTCNNKFIELLFTGRIDPLKGLFELIEAFNILLSKYNNIRLNIVGWENDKNKPVEAKLKELAQKYNISDRVLFHGKKTIGNDLNQMYRMCDIYILPSYEEGFPRTIWEAMANSLPVITTRVGGIPLYLSNGIDSIIIEPRNVEFIVESVSLIIDNNALRRKLISKGYSLAKENTLEIQSKKIMDYITLKI